MFTPSSTVPQVPRQTGKRARLTIGQAEPYRAGICMNIPPPVETRGAERKRNAMGGKGVENERTQCRPRLGAHLAR